MSHKQEGDEIDPVELLNELRIQDQGLKNAFGTAGASRVMAEYAKRQARSVLGPRSVNRRFKELSRILQDEADQLRAEGEADFGEPGNS